MTTKQDLRQIESKTQSFQQIGTATSAGLNSIVNNINEELNSPLRLHATFPTANSRLNFADSSLSAADGANKVASPVKKQVFDSISGAWIDFQTQTVSNIADFVISWPASTVGFFRRATFTLVDPGQIEVVFSNEFALEASLTNAGELFVDGGLPLGYINLECTNALGYFKTANSVSNVIENSKIYRFGAGSGGGAVNTITGIAGETIAIGDLLYISKGTGDDSLRTAGRLYLLDVNSDDRFVYIGIATNAALAGEEVTYQISGEFEFTHGGAAGDTLYADLSTPGGIISTEPTTNSSWSVVVGAAIDANNLIITNIGAASALYLEAIYGTETILNSQVVDQPINTFIFDSTEIKTFTAFYQVRRYTSLETKEESGLLMGMYSIDASDWLITTIGGVGSNSVTFDITNLGQVVYQSTNMSGVGYTGVIDFKVIDTIKV